MSLGARVAGFAQEVGALRQPLLEESYFPVLALMQIANMPTGRFAARSGQSIEFAAFVSPCGTFVAYDRLA